jgi:hypothetical protein
LPLLPPDQSPDAVQEPALVDDQDRLTRESHGKSSGPCELLAVISTVGGYVATVTEADPEDPLIPAQVAVYV